jgi:hypothetical protein
MSGLLLAIWAVVTLYMVIDRFSEAYGDPLWMRRKSSKRSAGRGANPRPFYLS